MVELMCGTQAILTEMLLPTVNITLPRGSDVIVGNTMSQQSLNSKAYSKTHPKLCHPTV